MQSENRESRIFGCSWRSKQKEKKKKKYDFAFLGLRTVLFRRKTLITCRRMSRLSMEWGHRLSPTCILLGQDEDEMGTEKVNHLHRTGVKKKKIGATTVKVQISYNKRYNNMLTTRKLPLTRAQSPSSFPRHVIGCLSLPWPPTAAKELKQTDDKRQFNEGNFRVDEKSLFVLKYKKTANKKLRKKGLRWEGEEGKSKNYYMHVLKPLFSTKDEIWKLV